MLCTLRIHCEFKFMYFCVYAHVRNVSDRIHFGHGGFVASEIGVIFVVAFSVFFLPAVCLFCCSTC